jgi:DNA (cytosine-5)-methyltransferase 1
MGKNIYTIAETFVGAGGSHLGFKKAGFKTVYANDHDPSMAQAFRLNNPELPPGNFDERSIEEISANDILKIAKIKRRELDVLFGGIVCCGFSLAGHY